MKFSQWWKFWGWIFILAVVIFLLLWVFPTGSRGGELDFLPKGTAAIVYHQGMIYYLEAINPERVADAWKQSEPHWWIGTGKWIAGGSAVAASYFYIASLEIPPLHPVFWTAKGTAAVLSATFTGIAAGAGMSVIWVDSRRQKVTWREANFYFQSPGEGIEIITLDEKRVIRKEGKEKEVKYIIPKEELFILGGEIYSNLPQGEVLKGKVLCLGDRKLFP